MRWKGLLLLLGGLGFGILMGLIIIQGGSLFPAADQSRKAPEIGQEAPDFTLSNLEGEPVQLSQFRGKVVFLNFWATWCVPCRNEMPILEQFARENAANVVVVGVNLNDSRETVVDFIKQVEVTFPIVLDEDARVSRQYLIRGYPTTVVIDSDGTIQTIHVGALTQENLVEDMELAERDD